MTGRLFIAAMFVYGLACTANCQNIDKAENVIDRINDNALGISFAKVGEVKKVDSSTYTIALQSPETSSARSALAEVAVSDRLFVDLPGSYGGKLYLDKLPGHRLLEDRVFSDTLNTGQVNFRREYWTVYAGMGMWEGVINCYARQGGEYYIVSLKRDMPLGKPGEVIDGSPLSSAQLKTRLLSALRDTSDATVKAFNKLLTSVEIQH
jgi:hypothetical protein